MIRLVHQRSGVSLLTGAECAGYGRIAKQYAVAVKVRARHKKSSTYLFLVNKRSDSYISGAE